MSRSTPQVFDPFSLSKTQIALCRAEQPPSKSDSAIASGQLKVYPPYISFRTTPCWTLRLYRVFAHHCSYNAIVASPSHHSRQPSSPLSSNQNPFDTTPSTKFEPTFANRYASSRRPNYETQAPSSSDTAGNLTQNSISSLHFLDSKTKVERLRALDAKISQPNCYIEGGIYSQVVNANHTASKGVYNQTLTPCTKPSKAKSGKVGILYW